MPIKEATIFKDGHALMLHSGSMPIDAQGVVRMDYLPAPVMGTFWAFSGDKDVKLQSVKAGQQIVKTTRTAMTIPEILQANIGAAVTLYDNTSLTHEGIIRGFPTQSTDELESRQPSGGAPMLPIKSDLLMLETSTGIKFIHVGQIIRVTFKGEPAKTLTAEEYRNQLELKLDMSSKKDATTVNAGMMYVQKGIRWIPNYRIKIDGNGKATVALQAEILNELADLNDVTCNLVIGVPNFAFKDTLDPIAMQTTMANLSQHFQVDSSARNAMSNAIMTQAPCISADYKALAERGGAGVPELGPEIGNSQKAEDLFVITVKHISLKKGERLIVPVKEFAASYEDIFVLNIPFGAPREVSRSFNTQQQLELAKLQANPKVMHKIRLKNDDEFPITTAPAMILLNDQVLCQSMTSYTPKGAPVDIDITTAVDIRAKKKDTENREEMNAKKWNNDNYYKVFLDGTISLTNYKTRAVKIEIVRHVFGEVSDADNGGNVEFVNIMEEPDCGSLGYDYPYWWGWYSWPYWWYHLNSVGRITWNVNIEPGKTVDLKYSWNYYWR